MKPSPRRDHHHGLHRLSDAAKELEACLTPLIPFGVEYWPWIDKIVRNFRRDVRGSAKRFEAAFGKTPARPKERNGKTVWVREFFVEDKHRIDLETYDVGKYRHGNVILYDLPPGDLQRKSL